MRLEIAVDKQSFVLMPKRLQFWHQTHETCGQSDKFGMIL